MHARRRTSWLLVTATALLAVAALLDARAGDARVVPAPSARPAPAPLATGALDGVEGAAVRAGLRIPVRARASDEVGDTQAAPPTLVAVVIEAGTGRGVPGALVLARAERAGTDRALERLCSTDAEGRASFGELEPGEWDVVGPDRGSVRIELFRGERRVVELEARGLLRVSGRVVDDAGLPVPGAEVVRSSHFGAALGWRTTPVARAGDDGAFATSSLFASELLHARAGGHSPSRRLQVGASAGDGAELRGVELVLERGSSGLSVRVRDSAGVCVAGATVSARRVGRQAPSTGDVLRFGAPPAEAVTDAQGWATFDGLPGGEVEVRAHPPAGLSAGRGLAVLAADQRSTVEIEVGFAGTIEGRVVDREGGAPGALVELTAADGRVVSRVRSGRAGRFTMTGIRIPRAPAAPLVALAAGAERLAGVLSAAARDRATFTLHAVHEERGEGRTSVGFERAGRERERCSVELVLDDAAAASTGRLVTSTGEPLGGWTVVLECRERGDRARAPLPTWARTDAAGTFELPITAAGRYEVRAHGGAVSRFLPALVREVVLPRSDPLDLVVEAGRLYTAWAIVEIVCSADATLVVREANRTAAVEAVELDLAGDVPEFRLGPFVPGRYSLVLRDLSGETALGEYVLVEGENVLGPLVPR